MDGSEYFEGYEIKINFTPEAVFDFGGFGWAFEVLKNDVSLFSLLIKSSSGRKLKTEVLAAKNWALKTIHELLRNESFQQRTKYCYEWDIRTSSADKVECDEIEISGR